MTTRPASTRDARDDRRWSWRRSPAAPAPTPRPSASRPAGRHLRRRHRHARRPRRHRQPAGLQAHRPRPPAWTAPCRPASTSSRRARRPGRCSTCSPRARRSPRSSRCPRGSPSPRSRRSPRSGWARRRTRCSPPRATAPPPARCSAIRCQLRGVPPAGDLHAAARPCARDELVRIMAEGFKAGWEPAWTARLDSLRMTQLQLVTFASIVEGEARADDERETIAGVYHNRLRIGMALQADPTVQYAIFLASGQAEDPALRPGLPDQVAVQHLPASRVCRRARSTRRAAEASRRRSIRPRCPTSTSSPARTGGTSSPRPTPSICGTSRRSGGASEAPSRDRTRGQADAARQASALAGRTPRGRRPR